MRNKPKVKKSNKRSIRKPKVKKSENGRPTLYSKNIILLVDEYLELCKDQEEVQIVGLSAKGTELYKNKLKVDLPTVEGFAVYIRVSKSTVYEWRAKYKEFSDALERISIEQQKRLLNNGLSGDYNPTIAKLVLSANHGMNEKTEQDLNVKGGVVYLPAKELLNNQAAQKEDGTATRDNLETNSKAN